jgi:type I restriction enzyme S subunit
METQYRKYRLGDLCKKIGSGATPTGGRESYHSSGISLIRSQNVYNNGFKKDGLAFINEEQGHALDNATVQPDDVLLNITGDSVARVCQVPNEVLPARVNQHVAIIRPDKSYLDPKFLRYYLVEKSFQRFLLALAAAGATRNALTKCMIDSLEITIPPLPTQRRIAHILGSLDDKIELNRQMNETIEAMARAIFKSWFVDFDPVRAKAEGRQPAGMAVEMAALFPDSFEEVDGREVPRGWKVIELEEISEIVDCLHAKKPERQESGMPYLQLCNIRDDGLLDMSDTFFITPQDYQKWISRTEAQKGDCLITNAGRVGAVCQIPDGIKAALGRNMTAIRLKQKYPYPTFLLEALLSSSMRQDIEMKIDRGTVLDSLNVRNIPKLSLIFPSGNREILEKFEDFCRPLREKMEKNFEESHMLAQIRDTLLPKLMSGEIRVDNIAV